MISAEVGDESEDVIVVDGQRRAATVGVESQTSSAGMKVRIASEKLRGGSFILRHRRNTKQYKEPEKP